MVVYSEQQKGGSTSSRISQVLRLHEQKTGAAISLDFCGGNTSSSNSEATHLVVGYEAMIVILWNVQ